ncbi:unnamed protein product [Arctia plantaginis]|uniref:Uncharacterized protein n=1 Tax=Arctia plantaginis TaxID=874455 RepID=A0A8S0Z1I0_ARCPL|nr:unnamed protein product [Arctia plantaginis]
MIEWIAFYLKSQYSDYRMCEMAKINVTRVVAHLQDGVVSVVARRRGAERGVRVAPAPRVRHQPPPPPRVVLPRVQLPELAHASERSKPYLYTHPWCGAAWSAEWCSLSSRRAARRGRSPVPYSVHSPVVRRGAVAPLYRTVYTHPWCGAARSLPCTVQCTLTRGAARRGRSPVPYSVHSPVVRRGAVAPLYRTVYTHPWCGAARSLPCTVQCTLTRGAARRGRSPVPYSVHSPVVRRGAVAPLYRTVYTHPWCGAAWSAEWCSLSSRRAARRGRSPVPYSVHSPVVRRGVVGGVVQLVEQARGAARSLPCTVQCTLTRGAARRGRSPVPYSVHSPVVRRGAVAPLYRTVYTHPWCGAARSLPCTVQCTLTRGAARRGRSPVPYSVHSPVVRRGAVAPLYRTVYTHPWCGAARSLPCTVQCTLTRGAARRGRSPVPYSVHSPVVRRGVVGGVVQLVEQARGAARSLPCTVQCTLTRGAARRGRRSGAACRAGARRGAVAPLYRTVYTHPWCGAARSLPCTVQCTLTRGAARRGRSPVPYSVHSPVVRRGAVAPLYRTVYTHPWCGAARSLPCTVQCTLTRGAARRGRSPVPYSVHSPVVRRGVVGGVVQLVEQARGAARSLPCTVQCTLTRGAARRGRSPVPYSVHSPVVRRGVVGGVVQLVEQARGAARSLPCTVQCTLTRGAARRGRSPVPYSVHSPVVRRGAVAPLYRTVYTHPWCGAAWSAEWCSLSSRRAARRGRSPVPYSVHSPVVRRGAVAPLYRTVYTHPWCGAARSLPCTVQCTLTRGAARRGRRSGAACRAGARRGAVAPLYRTVYTHPWCGAARSLPCTVQCTLTRGAARRGRSPVPYSVHSPVVRRGAVAPLYRTVYTHPWCGAAWSAEWCSLSSRRAARRGRSPVPYSVHSPVVRRGAVAPLYRTVYTHPWCGAARSLPCTVQCTLTRGAARRGRSPVPYSVHSPVVRRGVVGGVVQLVEQARGAARSLPCTVQCTLTRGAARRGRSPVPYSVHSPVVRRGAVAPLYRTVYTHPWCGAAWSAEWCSLSSRRAARRGRSPVPYSVHSPVVRCGAVAPLYRTVYTHPWCGAAWSAEWCSLSSRRAARRGRSPVPYSVHSPVVRRGVVGGVVQLVEQARGAARSLPCTVQCTLTRGAARRGRRSGAACRAGARRGAVAPLYRTVYTHPWCGAARSLPLYRTVYTHPWCGAAWSAEWCSLSSRRAARRGRSPVRYSVHSPVVRRGVVGGVVQLVEQARGAARSLPCTVQCTLTRGAARRGRRSGAACRAGARRGAVAPLYRTVYTHPWCGAAWSAEWCSLSSRRAARRGRSPVPYSVHSPVVRRGAVGGVVQLVEQARGAARSLPCTVQCTLTRGAARRGRSPVPYSVHSPVVRRGAVAPLYRTVYTHPWCGAARSLPCTVQCTLTRGAARRGRRSGAACRAGARRGAVAPLYRTVYTHPWCGAARSLPCTVQCTLTRGAARRGRSPVPYSVHSPVVRRGVVGGVVQLVEQARGAARSLPCTVQCTLTRGAARRGRRSGAACRAGARRGAVAPLYRTVYTHPWCGAARSLPCTVQCTLTRGAARRGRRSGAACRAGARRGAVAPLYRTVYTHPWCGAARSLPCTVQCTLTRGAARRGRSPVPYSVHSPVVRRGAVAPLYRTVYTHPWCGAARSLPCTVQCTLTRGAARRGRSPVPYSVHSPVVRRGVVGGVVQLVEQARGAARSLPCTVQCTLTRGAARRGRRSGAACRAGARRGAVAPLYRTVCTHPWCGAARSLPCTVQCTLTRGAARRGRSPVPYSVHSPVVRRGVVGGVVQLVEQARGAARSLPCTVQCTLTRGAARRGRSPVPYSVHSPVVRCGVVGGVVQLVEQARGAARSLPCTVQCTLTRGAARRGRSPVPYSVHSPVVRRGAVAPLYRTVYTHPWCGAARSLPCTVQCTLTRGAARRGRRSGAACRAGARRGAVAPLYRTVYTHPWCGAARSLPCTVQCTLTRGAARRGRSPVPYSVHSPVVRRGVVGGVVQLVEQARGAARSLPCTVQCTLTRGAARRGRRSGAACRAGARRGAVAPLYRTVYTHPWCGAAWSAEWCSLSSRRAARRGRSPVPYSVHSPVVRRGAVAPLYRTVYTHPWCGAARSLPCTVQCTLTRGAARRGRSPVPYSVHSPVVRRGAVAPLYRTVYTHPWCGAARSLPCTVQCTLTRGAARRGRSPVPYSVHSPVVRRGVVGGVVQLVEQARGAARSLPCTVQCTLTRGAARRGRSPVPYSVHSPVVRRGAVAPLYRTVYTHPWCGAARSLPCTVQCTLTRGAARRGRRSGAACRAGARRGAVAPLYRTVYTHPWCGAARSLPCTVQCTLTRGAARRGRSPVPYSVHSPVVRRGAVAPLYRTVYTHPWCGAAWSAEWCSLSSRRAARRGRSPVPYSVHSPVVRRGVVGGVVQLVEQARGAARSLPCTVQCTLTRGAARRGRSPVPYSVHSPVVRRGVVGGVVQLVEQARGAARSLPCTVQCTLTRGAARRGRRRGAACRAGARRGAVAPLYRTVYTHPWCGAARSLPCTVQCTLTRGAARRGRSPVPYSVHSPVVRRGVVGGVAQLVEQARGAARSLPCTVQCTLTRGAARRGRSPVPYSVHSPVVRRGVVGGVVQLVEQARGAARSLPCTVQCTLTRGAARRGRRSGAACRAGARRGAVAPLYRTVYTHPWCGAAWSAEWCSLSSRRAARRGRSPVPYSVHSPVVRRGAVAPLYRTVYTHPWCGAAWSAEWCSLSSRRAARRGRSPVPYSVHSPVVRRGAVAPLYRTVYTHPWCGAAWSAEWCSLSSRRAARRGRSPVPYSVHSPVVRRGVVGGVVQLVEQARGAARSLPCTVQCTLTRGAARRGRRSGAACRAGARRGAVAPLYRTVYTHPWCGAAWSAEWCSLSSRRAARRGRSPVPYSVHSPVVRRGVVGGVVQLVEQARGAARSLPCTVQCTLTRGAARRGRRRGAACRAGARRGAVAPLYRTVYTHPWCGAARSAEWCSLSSRRAARRGRSPVPYSVHSPVVRRGVVGGVVQLVEQARGGGVVAAARGGDEALAGALLLPALRAARRAQALRTHPMLYLLISPRRVLYVQGFSMTGF